MNTDIASTIVGRAIIEKNIKIARLRADNAKLRAYLGALLDCVDYTSGACRINEPIAGVLPRVVLDNAKAALEATK